MSSIGPSHVWRFLTAQLRPLPSQGHHDFRAKTFIITGANVGLGLEAARHFVQSGASKVILACRDTQKGEAAREDIESSTSKGGVAEVWPLDLSSFESVRHFCQRAADSLDRIDAVVESAGVATPTFSRAEGFESSVTTNVLSTFLMALLLLPKLRVTAARFNTRTTLTIVSSDAHHMAAFKERTQPRIFDFYRSEETMSNSRYNTTKLLEVLLVRELADRLDASAGKRENPVVVNCLNPGFCRTQLFRNLPFPLNFIIGVALVLLGRTPEMGSRTLIAAAAGGRETHGKYMDSCRVSDPSRFVLSTEGAIVQKRVYDEVMDILEQVEPAISKNVGP